MREILFRGKREDNGEWVYGYYAYCTDGEKLSHRIYNSFAESYGEEKLIPLRFEVIPETVGQFTGMTDKNGNKIFEYDICNVNESVYEVVFKYGTWTFEKISKEVWNCPNFYSHCDDDCEIIGNVFDNPELLEGKLK